MAFVRVSTPAGHFSVPAAIAARAGDDWAVLDEDAVDEAGRPLPSKLRDSIGSNVSKAKATARKSRTRKPRRSKPAATTPNEPETVSGDTPKE